MYKPALTAAALLALAACSGGKPDAAEFEKAINRHAAAQGVCMPLRLYAGNGTASGNPLVGEPVIKIAERGADGQKPDKLTLKQINLLDKEGFYKKARTETVSAPDGRDVKIQVYELTEKGRAQSRPSPNGTLFCVGVLKVNKINWFTEPTPSDGVTVAKVSYEARLETAKWADAFLYEEGSKDAHPETVRTLSATLVKTNDGWHDIRELR